MFYFLVVGRLIKSPSFLDDCPSLFSSSFTRATTFAFIKSSLFWLRGFIGLHIAPYALCNTKMKDVTLHRQAP